MRQRFGTAIFVATAAAVPVFADDFQLLKLTGVLVFAIALLGLNMLTGYNGQISLGHGAFYTLGAVFLQLIVLLSGAVAQSAKTAAVLAIYGVVVIVFLHLLPNGVAGLVAKLVNSKNPV